MEVPIFSEIKRVYYHYLRNKLEGIKAIEEEKKVIQEIPIDENMLLPSDD